MIPNELTIELSEKDGRLSVDTLVKSLENALEMLRGIESRMIAAGVDVRWEIVRVQMNSPLRVTFAPDVRRIEKSGAKGRPNLAIGRKLVREASRAIAGIETGRRIPPSFGESAIDGARKLIKTAESDGAEIAFESPFLHKTTLTKNAAQQLEELSSKARLYVDFTTIEGRLEVASVHERNSFTIWETLTKNRIECYVSEEQMQQAATLLGRRVAIMGRVSYRNHVPKTIRVEGEIRVLRSSSELPQPKDISPIDITGGLSSEDHVRRLRNA